ncbi:DUF2938 domain-containing protein [Fodinibius salsisoli]|uniref:DUF2938 domain-containing protein n=1 Tax=Fodinibius salsisoli TaxID=2820877 RepID=A0ABT3PK56_9BACT|nr:DUF2938 domain-containing protein [Fodinibius salsisoli]MCW9706287.1 DUF2938 domain-containing protein [Fodinibius salsisoli]
MSDWTEIVLHAIPIGIGATLLMDFWAILLKRFFGIPSLDYCMVGRWIGHFSHRRLSHKNIGQSQNIQGECTIGWTAHYIIGIMFSLLLLMVCGLSWTNQPTLLPALTIGIITVAAPLFLLQPGLGAGIAASKTPRPNLSRLLSIAAHSVYGIGLYLSALFLTLFHSNV